MRVIRPGLLTTVQDDGRWGYQRFGVPVAGPMDRMSHRLANLLVGNRPSASTLEVTLVGPHLEFDDDALFAVTGAEFELRLEGALLAPNTVHRARSGQRLVFGERRWGARAYLGVAGGIDVPMVFGSRATHVGSRLGGVEGRAVVAGDTLRVGDAGDRRVSPGQRRRPVVTPRGEEGRAVSGAQVRVIPGPHEHRFGPEGLRVLESGRYTVGISSDRMGYRLEGPAIEQTTDTELLSAPVDLGAIQVPPSGQPIILMADRQTTGGYARIGTVITADIPAVAQLVPSNWIAFRLCSHQDALRALVAAERLFA